MDLSCRKKGDFFLDLVWVLQGARVNQIVTRPEKSLQFN
ncbi:MAG: hypothetical protein UZ14_CFX002003192 [Chloroflexi bacterium OLB14]|nr:MAG: hypothetical protein UZ14_CFX002003192 [Chloroflexi bacterium OLB14]